MFVPKIKQIIVLTLITFSTILIAQPDPPGGGHGGDSNEGAGGGAPIGSGVVTLIVLSLVWGGRKVYFLHKQDLEE